MRKRAIKLIFYEYFAIIFTCCRQRNKSSSLTLIIRSWSKPEKTSRYERFCCCCCCCADLSFLRSEFQKVGCSRSASRHVSWSCSLSYSPSCSWSCSLCSRLSSPSCSCMVMFVIMFITMLVINVCCHARCRVVGLGNQLSSPLINSHRRQATFPRRSEGPSVA